jgi:glycosyltransferase involved in cell wall biosynthesis
MRIVMVCRKYSGIGRDLWSPAGAPAVLKLIEAIEARGLSATVLFLAKSPQAGAGDLVTDYGRFKHVRFVHLGWRGVRGAPALLSEVVNSVRQSLRTIPYLSRRADLLYFDRGHLVLAALASLFHRRVIWRCLGVMSFLLARDNGKRLGLAYLWLARILVGFPIKMIICTNDGSPWFRLFASRRSRRKLLLVTNGIDRSAMGTASCASSAGASIPTIGYVGRATVAKGLDVFVDACGELARRGIVFRALVVGDGAARAGAERKALALGLTDIMRFVGAVPHAEVAQYLAAMRIYVSPARNGGFSNTTLEALAAGCCIVALGPDPARGVDLTTFRFVPERVVRWVDRADPARGIADAVSALLADPTECARRQGEAREFARTQLPSWDERIRVEVEVLEALARGEPPPAGTMRWDGLAQIAYTTAPP